MTVTIHHSHHIKSTLSWWVTLLLIALLLNACDGSSVSQSDDDVSQALQAWSEGDIATATKFQLQAISKNPDHAELHVMLARIYMEGKNKDAARAAFKKSLALGIDRSIIIDELAQLGELSNPSNPWTELRKGQWIKIHEQKPTDNVIFKRQAHGGSAFDSKRNQIVLFGSDTHGKNWTNSPLLFDTENLEWHRMYNDDEPDSYKVNINGIPIAGTKEQHPWAMHTFGAVEYDATRDELVVSSYSAHMKPGRFSDALAHVWSNVSSHPTWLLNLDTEIWHPLESKATHFFPYATAFDSHRGVVVGYRDNGVYELEGEPRRWRRVLPKSFLGYHNNAVYDSWYKKVIVLGSNKNSNDIIAYNPESRKQRKMPTPGNRPPKSQFIPMAFHDRIGKTIALIDYIPAGIQWNKRDKTTTHTWAYDLFTDSWEEIKSATLPFGRGMNYNLEYDADHDALLLVTSEPGKPTSVWALRL